jgi:hypothetical protein
MDLSDGDSPKSWAVLRDSLYREEWGDGWQPWLHLARPLFEDLQRAGLAEHFRIGASMDVLILSTCERHELGDALRVEIRPEPPSSFRVRLADFCFHFDDTTGDPVLVSRRECMATVIGLLRRMWLATRNGQRLPPAIAARQEPG